MTYGFEDAPSMGRVDWDIVSWEKGTLDKDLTKMMDLQDGPLSHQQFVDGQPSMQPEIVQINEWAVILSSFRYYITI